MADVKFEKAALDPIRKRAAELGSIQAAGREIGLKSGTLNRVLVTNSARGKNVTLIRKYLRGHSSNGTKPSTETPTNGTAKQHRTQAQEIPDHNIIFAFGRTQGWLDAYAESIGVPSRHLTQRVGELLHRTEGGSLRRA